MDPDGNRLQNSCSPRHWGHSTMHRVPPVFGTTTTICMKGTLPIHMHSDKIRRSDKGTYHIMPHKVKALEHSNRFTHKHHHKG